MTDLSLYTLVDAAELAGFRVFDPSVESDWLNEMEDDDAAYI